MKHNSYHTPQLRLSRKTSTWLTLGTVAAYAAVSITRSVPAWAQDATPANSKPREQQKLTVRRLDIPAGPLDFPWTRRPDW